MKWQWQRVPIVSRLVCLLFGFGTAAISWLLLSHPDSLKHQSLETLFYLVSAAFGMILFLFVGIVGKFPALANHEQGGAGG
jgi:apolipoprotein N-acyltransferase